MNNIKTITRINKIIVPVLIAIIFVIGIVNICKIEEGNLILNNTKKISFIWIFESLIYASYNLIILIPVLVNLRKLIKSEKQILVASIFTGVILFFISIIMFLLLANNGDKLKNIEMPAIYVIENNFTNFKYVYGITILIAIFTTAISVGMSFANNICKDGKMYARIVKILCISSIFVSKIGFSNLVEILFPIFGVLGFIQICFVVCYKE